MSSSCIRPVPGNLAPGLNTGSTVTVCRLNIRRTPCGLEGLSVTPSGPLGLLKISGVLMGNPGLRAAPQPGAPVDDVCRDTGTFSTPGSWRRVPVVTATEGEPWPLSCPSERGAVSQLVSHLPGA